MTFVRKICTYNVDEIDTSTSSFLLHFFSDPIHSLEMMRGIGLFQTFEIELQRLQDADRVSVFESVVFFEIKVK
jgi:hypothetical protein